MTSLLKLLPWCRPYVRQFLIGLLCVVVSSALYSLIPTLLRQAIDAMEVGAPWIDIVAIAGIMIAVTLVMAFFRFWMREILNGVSRVIENDMRDALFVHLTKLDAAWYNKTRTGEIMARLTNDLGAVRMAAGPAIMYLTSTIVGGVFALSFMVAISPRLTLTAVAPMAILPFVALRLGRLIHDRFERVQSHFGDITTMVQEHLSGIRIVRAYRQESPEVNRFDEMSSEYLDRNMQLVRMNGLMTPSFTLFAGLGAAAVLGFGGAMVVENKMSIGAFVAFGLYLANLTWPLIALGWVTSLFQRGAASMKRLTEIFDATPIIHSPEPTQRAPDLPPTAGGRTVTLENIRFSYPVSEKEVQREVLSDVSITIPAGTTLGVVGATGSGKSALLELIPRIYDPTGGRILLDGVDIRDLPLETLRAEIGFVPQESLLFSDTILANLGYGTESVDHARWGADIAQLTATIEGFPDGFETMLGERGINLSGGQKQRASLARALARRPSVVILDDSLSAVDTHTEAAILKGLRETLTDRTAIIASHRITAVRDAQQIVVLDRGRIVERGGHEELLSARGRYWELLRRQQLEEEIEGAEVTPGT